MLLKATLEANHDYPFRVEYRAQGNAPASAAVAWAPPAAGLLAEAEAAVKDADVAIAFVGLNPSLEGEEMRVTIPGFQGGDRTDLNLPEAQEQLLEKAIGTGKPVIVVLTSGSALAANFAAEKAAAVLALWYGGEEAGTAIAETLAGVNNPAGRLPVTFYKGVEQLPPFDDYSMDGRTYRYFKGDPLWGFGYGLSYAKFAYSGLRTERTAKGARVSVRVKNDSPREGDEVVQLYLSGAGRFHPRPARIPPRSPQGRGNAHGGIHDRARGCSRGEGEGQRRRRSAGRRCGPRRRRSVNATARRSRGRETSG